MKFKLTYGYVYACIATLGEDLDAVYSKCQNMYVSPKLESWRKNVAEDLNTYYEIILNSTMEHTVDADAIERVLGVIKYLELSDIEFIKQFETPELDAMGLAIRSAIVNRAFNIKKSKGVIDAVMSETLPWVDKKIKDSGGNIPW